MVLSIGKKNVPPINELIYIETYDDFLQIFDNKKLRHKKIKKILKKDKSNLEY